MPVRRRQCLVFGLLLWLAACPAMARGEARHCDGRAIRVEGRSGRDLDAACEAVARASSFFDKTGLRLPDGLVLRLVSDKDASVLGESEVGHYDARRRLILVRDFQSYRAPSARPRREAGAAASRPFWQSWIVHELAHAAVDRRCDRACRARGVHEYIAAAVQLATLDERVRAEFLAAYGNVDAFASTTEISEIYYELNPRYFAVKSYKHFASQPDPRAFLGSLMAAPGSP